MVFTCQALELAFGGASIRELGADAGWTVTLRTVSTMIARAAVSTTYSTGDNRVRIDCRLTGLLRACAELAGARRDSPSAHERGRTSPTQSQCRRASNKHRSRDDGGAMCSYTPAHCLPFFKPYRSVPQPKRKACTASDFLCPRAPVLPYIRRA
ncbi:hypothetical protein DAEQUDRAFT_212651 [Daedalea quercina L-15889]|uniref:Uncharacterized protein n=1 Tax=Daedalea quercina L-15889 TaxID=1314783 RepID=A0A165KHH4_9APHY|nr:hypothetical protein DAEQUDRAFT_212651 [Daedalea quercina L-15889]